MTNRLTQGPSRLLSTKDAATFTGMLINDIDFENEEMIIAVNAIYAIV